MVEVEGEVVSESLTLNQVDCDIVVSEDVKLELFNGEPVGTEVEIHNPILSETAERRGHTLKGFNTFYLIVRASIWR